MEQARIIEVTPEMAEALLAGNSRNRPINRSRVKEYAAAMKAGEWAVNNDAIMICVDGTLVNGQHRLMAIVAFGAPVMMLVVTGASETAYQRCDTGKLRTVADALGILGMTNTNRSASALALLVAYDARRVALSAHVTKVRILDAATTLAQYPGLDRSVAVTARHRVTDRRAAWATAHYIFARFDADAADAFIIDVGTGEMLAPGNPALTLRNRAMAEYASGAGAAGGGASRILALAIMAWNARREGRSLTKLVLPSETNCAAFPVAR